MKKYFFTAVLVSFLFAYSTAQETARYTHELKDYYHAIELYHNKAYVAAQVAFNKVKEQFDAGSEMRANCDYYAANAAIRLGQRNADELMQSFVDNYPNSTKRNDAFMEVADYYYKTGKYSYALKWLKRVNYKNMPRRAFEDYLFKYGYSLFVTKNQTASKKYFVQLLDSPEYGAQAKYYYGYIAYEQDDYDNADKYLTEVSEDKQYKKEVSYYMADMNFKLGRFQKAIDAGLPLLKTAKRVERSEINKIIGESYFNLNQYDKAIPYLKEYKGKRGKWINTDYYLLGYAYYMQNDYENAISYFNRIIDGNNAVAQNAYYHLAECYLKLDKKTEALNAFRNASQMDFKPQIKEDAFYNYAKLSYEIGNPYKSVPEVLQDFLLAYPHSVHKDEINNLIISAYVVSKDYEGALFYLEKNKIPDEALYQEIAFMRAIELFDDTKYEKAIQHFNKALEHPIDAVKTARSTYWKAEAEYQMKDYSKAIQDYMQFKQLHGTSDVLEFKDVDYQLGYTHFKQKKYNEALPNFKSYVNSLPSDKQKLSDAYLRLGDTYFVTASYNNAVNAYKEAEDLAHNTADYALFQQALSYGFLKNNSKKISLLNQLINSYPKSSYRDDALFVLGGVYTHTNQTSIAVSTYDKLLTSYPKSMFVPRALLKKGLIFYNNNENEKALQVYKKTVKQFPSTAYAQEAVRNARQIYIDMGRVDDYALWVKDLDFVNVSDVEIDNDMYESAEKQYMQNEYDKAISAFKKYLQNFPKGLHALQAHFYIAQAYEYKNKKAKTIPHYKYIVAQTQNEYTEQALTRLSQYYLDNNNWDEALSLLQKLEMTAEHTENVLYAQSNLMKAYYNKENYTKAVSYAEKVLQHTTATAKVKSDAQIIIARSAIQTGDEAKARTAYANVESIATGELKAEALYYKALFMYKDGNYKNSNVVVQRIASDYAAYKYWGAKSLIVMAKNFYALKDAYQATYILKSVIKNFQEYDDVVEEAQTELNKIKKEEAKTNDSVLPEDN